jgi:hypothetical protein
MRRTKSNCCESLNEQLKEVQQVAEEQLKEVNNTLSESYE